MPNLDPTPILDVYPWRSQPRQEVHSLGNAGGLSGSKLWKFVANDKIELILRAWPSDQAVISRVEKVHSWLKHVDIFACIPRVRQVRDGLSVIQSQGRCWDLSTWMTGNPANLSVPSDIQVVTALETLAHLHERWSGLDAGFAASPGLIRRYDELNKLHHGDWDVLRQAVASSPLRIERELALEVLAMVRRFLKPMTSNALFEGLSLHPCIRDARPEHFLFDPTDRLTGLIDFCAMDVETPAADLSRLISEWFPTNLERQAFALDAYERIRPLDHVERRAIHQFGHTSTLLTGIHWIRWCFVEHRHFDDPGALEHGLRKALSKLTARVD